MHKFKKIVITTMLLLALSVSTLSIPLPSLYTNSDVSISEAVSIGKRNALAHAKRYLSVMAFSKKGLIKQLRYEGYTKAEAKYGVAHCGANWKKQAVKKAKSYLRTMPMSKKRLYSQLLYEGFTKKQAKYGVKKAYK